MKNGNDLVPFTKAYSGLTDAEFRQITAWVRKNTLQRFGPVRQVTLRQVQDGSEVIYGGAADWVRSEACLKLDFGPGRLPGLLVMGAEDPHMFSPQQGTDLLTFFTGVFERAMRRWLS